MRLVCGTERIAEALLMTCMKTGRTLARSLIDLCVCGTFQAYVPSSAIVLLREATGNSDDEATRAPDFICGQDENLAQLEHENN